MGLLGNPAMAPFSQRDVRSLLLPAGLLAAACVATLAFTIPAGHTLSWTEMLGTIVEEGFTVSIVSVVTVAALSPAALHRNKAEFLRLAQQASVTALWLAPLLLFLRERSLWTLPIAALLAVILTSSLKSKNAPWDADSDLSLIAITADRVPVGASLHLEKSVLAALLVSAAGSTFDDAPGPLPPASDPSPTTAPRSVTATSAPILRFRNLIGPPPIALTEFSTH